MKIDLKLYILILLAITLISKQAQAGQYIDDTILINWISSDKSTANFTMSSSGISNGNYIAFGFSRDQQMVKINKNVKKRIK